MRRRTETTRIAGGFAVAAAVGLLAGCVGLPRAASVPADGWLPGWTAARIATADDARAALRAVDRQRERLGHVWSERERACYARFRVNGCLADLRGDRLHAQDALDTIAIAARARLRQEDAVARHADEADRLAQEAAAAGQREYDRARAAAERARRQAEFEERERQQQADQAARMASQPERSRRAQARQAEVDERARRAAERAAQAPANRAEYERKQAEAQRRAAARLERDARQAREREAAQGAPSPRGR